jgi:hypothetical protein
MKENLSKFKGELLDVPELYHQLRNRCFLKTQLDVVYTDFTNWERYNLLFIDHDVEKGMWKKLNYIEYTWMKIVEQLRKFGFPYDEIKLIKKEITNYIPTDELIKSALSKKKELDELIPKASNLIEKHKSELSEILKIKITYFEMLIYNAISYNQNTSLQFFNDGDGGFSFLSKAIYDESVKTDQIDLITETTKKTYLNVSLNSILSKFLDSDNNLDQTKTMMLSNDEYALLKIIRNRSKSVIGINIKIKENKFERIDIESTKKVEVEARLMDFIKKGGYQTIEIVTQDGLITSFKNKQKIKL